MKAGHLKALTGVYRRSTAGGRPRAKDPNVQRGHEEERSRKIRDFVEFGYPLCDMGDTARADRTATELRKPGWLPTAILVNVLSVGAERNGIRIPECDAIRVEDSKGGAFLHLPSGFSGVGWEPTKVYPLEVIDGQHRLWAFDGYDPGDDFELPVVAFCGLDHGWQAYLFWSVNITPKRINRSLAFDLYPLLRKQAWLDRPAGHSIYRETRSQELVEALWSYPDSPWYQRINMLGERKSEREYQGPMVTQAAWVRSLMATFVKQPEGRSGRIGGIFGGFVRVNETVLPWTRPMQAAFLVYSGKVLKEHVKASGAKWAQHLRGRAMPKLFDADDPAFYGEYSLISTDQGVRGFLSVVNDLCALEKESLRLGQWQSENATSEGVGKGGSATDADMIESALKSLAKTEVAGFIDGIAKRLAEYDWRTSSAPGMSDAERLKQSVFRGSSGYKELRRQLLVHLAGHKDRCGSAAHNAVRILGY
jgi:hypothetical protein